MNNKIQHFPVLLNEVINALSLYENDVYIDATFGLGGYTKEILSKKNCKVVAIDRDPYTRVFADNLKKVFSDRLHFVNGKFSNLVYFLKEQKIQKVGGVVFDLGVSSPQLDIKNRGFSFKHDGPLDMRMSCDGPTAEEFLDEVEGDILANIIYELGDEVFSKRIARNIIKQRSINKIKTTHQLAEIIRDAIPVKKNKIDPATKTFQAIRIYLNDEIKELEDGLIAAERVLRPEGRLAVVSFHSIEDRIVKKFFLKCMQDKSLSRYLPELPKKNPSLEILTKKPILPSTKEVNFNKRSRSAKLRIAKRTNFPSIFGEI